MMDPPSDDELILEVKHQGAMRAGELSLLLGELARDYQRFRRGHELMVAGLSDGHGIVLRAALDGAAGAKLQTFGKRLHEHAGQASRARPSDHNRAQPKARDRVRRGAHHRRYASGPDAQRGLVSGSAVYPAPGRRHGAAGAVRSPQLLPL